MECFICFSTSGKTDDEISFEQIFNQKTMNYPLLSMAYAYNCKCINNYAHNKCLININKCPTCRKEAEPNLYIYTRYDYYFSFLLDWLKKDISNIEKLNRYILSYLIFICGFLFLCSKNQKMINTIIPPKSNISLCFAIIISSSFCIALYLFVVFSDYIQKYWLYNKTEKRCYAFKNSYSNDIVLQEHLHWSTMLRNYF